MARLEEDPTHSRSGCSTDPSASGSGSGGENWTFGHPMAWQRQEMREQRAQQEEEEVEEEEEGLSREYVRGQQPSPVIERDSESESSHSSVPIVVHESPYMSATSLSPPSVFRPQESEGMSVSSSHPDISIAAASFVTAPATIEAFTTEESVRTVSGSRSPEHDTSCQKKVGAALSREDGMDSEETLSIGRLHRFFQLTA